MSARRASRGPQAFITARGAPPPLARSTLRALPGPQRLRERVFERTDRRVLTGVVHRNAFPERGTPTQHPRSACLTMMPSGRTMRGCESLPLTGFLISVDVHFNEVARLHSGADALHSMSYRTASGPRIVGQVHASVPQGPPTVPPTSVAIAARWRSSARSSTRISASPFPS